MNVKLCNKCKELKSTSEFYRNRTRPDGFGSQCKQCVKDHMITVTEKKQLYRKKYYQRPEVKERGKQKIIKRKLEDPRLYKIQRLLYNAKYRARDKNMKFSVTASDLGDWRSMIHCPILPWIVLNWESNNCSDNCPTIDRQDNTLGYVPGNVHIVSWRANSIKSNATDKEIIALAKYLTEPKN
jgi:hypothetical protein